MKNRFWIGIVLVLLMAVALFHYSGFYGSWRYKMTVVVETPEGIKAGSAVREVRVMQPLINWPQATASKKTDGEAVVVDLGGRGILFALLKGPEEAIDHHYHVFFEAFPIEGAATPKGVKYYRSLKNAKTTLTIHQYPQLVTFKDLQDPATVKDVYEMERVGKNEFPIRYHLKADRFEEFFGEGIKLKEITIETTGEPVTHRILEVLPFLTDSLAFSEWFREHAKELPRERRTEFRQIMNRRYYIKDK